MILKNIYIQFQSLIIKLMVPRVGLEPPRREARDPKSRMSTNSITSAKQGNYILILIETHAFD